jgi:hypothetical protein
MPSLSGQVPAEVSARFRAAEARLYPLAMVDPDGYEQATTLVGAVVTELRSCADVTDLLARCDVVRSRLPEIAEAAGVELPGMPAEVIVDAAAAIRCRELEGAGPGGAGVG